jgi:hypothetical protein
MQESMFLDIKEWSTCILKNCYDHDEALTLKLEKINITENIGDNYKSILDKLDNIDSYVLGTVVSQETRSFLQKHKLINLEKQT